MWMMHALQHKQPFDGLVSSVVTIETKYPMVLFMFSSVIVISGRINKLKYVYGYLSAIII